MSIYAEVIAASCHANDFTEELFTVQARYPRFIHPEVLTHRAFSRNASSSRATPVRRLLRDILADMAIPSHWGRNERGMQAHTELSGWRKAFARGLWRTAGYTAVGFAWLLDWLGAHKQVVNRIVEPWSHITVVITSSDWSNFFDLRLHTDAQPEIRELAHAIRQAIGWGEYEVTALVPGEWHLPYVSEREITFYGGHTDPTGILRKISTARCARVSYLTHNRLVPEPSADIALYERLVGARPIHASPAEHQATPDFWMNELTGWAQSARHGNLTGFVQHRKLVEEGMKP